ncbi:MAG: LptF/LptG family permease [Rickettsiales bacterium]|jgi:lipopolysaccharide export system permease protein|nr:LptF/LptG family permease [Rickettsiales bacterium]
MILDKYFSRQISSAFLLLLLLLAGLAWILQVLTMMKFLMNYGIDAASFLGMTALMIPFIISIIFPFVLFISVLTIYSKMISQNEITIMMASGMSPHRIALPALRLGVILAAAHFVLNAWVVPASQARFYDTQWELRYGLAHIKLQESAFTEMGSGLVVYVQNVFEKDLNQVMLFDYRDKKTEFIISAEKGKLFNTEHGISVALANGGLQARDKTTDKLTIGTFASFDIDLNLSDKDNSQSFKVRRISTSALLKTNLNNFPDNRKKQILSELSSRLLNPLNNIILTIACVLIMLKSSLLRRRFSFSAPFAVAAMAGIIGIFMTMSNMLTHFADLILVGGAQIAVIGLLYYALVKKH